MEIILDYEVGGKMLKTYEMGFHFDNSQVTKSHPKGDDDIKFSID